MEIRKENMEKLLPDFLIIPSSIVLDNRLQPLDGYVYGVVYWYSKLRLQKCIASNAEIGRLLNSSGKSVSNSLQRLNKHGYVQVVLGDMNQRLEIIPLVSFQRKDEAEFLPTPTSNDVPPYIKQNTPPTSNDVHNNKKLTIKDNNMFITEAKELLDHWNKTYKTKFSSPSGILDNLAYWLTQYSMDDIKRAITNVQFDNFWRDKMTPVILFRRKNPRAERVDYIGQMLNVKPPKEFANQGDLKSKYQKYD